ncbi:hypothetical protein JMJ35_003589 [Cladonia borealis]|uniref:DUF7703 domain-containing protein n=1 Tax=Cladonia borealis TaxID=184061 RepID=A0AA39V2Z2_9LECA|nr:hypothetical protein JMJ35_003589 [Cladonia borealis]
MSTYSPYADAESAAPDWKPGEEEAATAFLSLTLWLILDVNVGIYRVFKKKRGLYYWSLIIGTWACALSTIGNILKNLTPQYGPKIWPFWTLLINGGWSVYAAAECIVLYSRLHLVNRSPQVQRRILWFIIIGSFLLILPNWVFIFPAYDVNSTKVSSIWSPRQAILDRTSQLGFTVIESTISATYLWSLAKLLRVKSTVRQRVVMRDLIRVNIIVIAFDLVVTILVFLNQTNLSYSIQDFTYALKFKLEFVVLNQLMAVAAKGLRKESFAERRYNYPAPETDHSTGASSTDKTSIPLQQFSQTSQDPRDKTAALPVPSPAHTKTPRDRYERKATDETPLQLNQLRAGSSLDAEKDNDNGSETTEVEDSNTKNEHPSYDIHLKSNDGKSPKGSRSLLHPLGGRKEQGSEKEGVRAVATKHTPRGKHHDDGDEDDEEEEIGVHMWENRGKLILDVPWLKDQGKSA